MFLTPLFRHLGQKCTRPVMNVIQVTPTSSYASTPSNQLDTDLASIPPERIRNFSIIAHIDHGKSTLADRLLEITGTIRNDRVNKQVLDKLKVERDRGITVKAQTVSMFHTYKGQRYLLNLIDTPGHVDFSYEVSRSLAACQGALLLIDAAQGIQAQTVANFYLAFGQKLTIVPILNKIDLPAADPDRVALQIQNAFQLPIDNMVQISGKSGLHCERVLDVIVERLNPPPTPKTDTPLKAFLFDSWYDTYVGVVTLFSVVDGVLRKGDKVVSCHSNKRYEILDCGIMHPNQVPTNALYPGQVGYAVLGMKSTHEAHVGDTYHLVNRPCDPLPGFKPAKPMVFSGVFPTTADEFARLNDAVNKLVINDRSVSVSKETSSSLGQGFRLGFLGTLHLDVFRQRLEEEYSANVICTEPTVPFRITYKNGRIQHIRNPVEFPESTDLAQVQHIEEPVMNATIITPDDHLGRIIELCQERRGEQVDMTYLDANRVILKYRLPMSEVVSDFYNELKSRSSGYATFDYEESGYQVADVVKLDILLNGKAVDTLASIRHRSKAQLVAKKQCSVLKNVLDRQLYEIIIQGSVGGSKIVARESIAAQRKNVLARCSGGDVTRKMKLLARQKQGKKQMKMIGSVEITHEAYLTMMRQCNQG